MSHVCLDTLWYEAQPSEIIAFFQKDSVTKTTVSHQCGMFSNTLPSWWILGQLLFLFEYGSMVIFSVGKYMYISPTCLIIYCWNNQIFKKRTCIRFSFVTRSDLGIALVETVSLCMHFISKFYHMRSSCLVLGNQFIPIYCLYPTRKLLNEFQVLQSWYIFVCFMVWVLICLPQSHLIKSRTCLAPGHEQSYSWPWIYYIWRKYNEKNVWFTEKPWCNYYVCECLVPAGYSWYVLNGLCHQTHHGCCRCPETP